MIIQFSVVIYDNDNCEVDEVIGKFSEYESIELVNLRNEKSTYAIESLEVDEVTRSSCEGELLYGNKTHIKRYIRTKQTNLNFGDLVIIDNVEYIIIKSNGELYLQSLYSESSIFKGSKISSFDELYLNLTILYDFAILKIV